MLFQMHRKTRLKYFLSPYIWKWKKWESGIQTNRDLAPSLPVTVMSFGEIVETHSQFSFLSNEGLGHGTASSPFSNSKH